MTSLKISEMASAHAGIEYSVHGNDAAKRRLFIRGKGFVPCFAQCTALCHAAWIGVLQDCERGPVASNSAINSLPQSGQEVVVGELFAVQLLEIFAKFP